VLDAQRAAVRLLPSGGLRNAVSGHSSDGCDEARYVGLVKVRLQHLLTAAAQCGAYGCWLHGVPPHATRTSRFAALALE